MIGSADRTPRCSEAAAHHPLAGTAPVTQRWWLVESRDTWGARPIRDADEEWLRVWSAWDPSEARALLVRPHGRLTPQDQRRIWTFRPGSHHVLRCSLPWGADPGIEEPGISHDDLQTAPHMWSESSDHPRVVVCTNGRRDLCCAERGRALLDGLPPQIADLAWECTHLGGHRFSPTALVIPAGLIFGRLSVADVTAMIERNAMDLDTVRGRSDLQSPQQVAELSIRRKLELRSMAEPLEVSPAEGSDREVSVTVRYRDHDHPVVLRRVDLPGVPVSCGREAEPVSTWVTV